MESWGLGSGWQNRLRHLLLVSQSAIGTIFLFLVLAVACQPQTPPPAPAAAPPTSLTVAVDKTSARAGDTVSLEVVLYAAGTGLSGYDLTVTVRDGSVAEIAEVKFPDFGLTDATSLPAASVRLRTADLQDIVRPGAERAVLATLRVRAKKAGSTPVEVAIKAMDDDKGEPLSPQAVAGALEVR